MFWTNLFAVSKPLGNVDDDDDDVVVVAAADFFSREVELSC